MKSLLLLLLVPFTLSAQDCDPCTLTGPPFPPFFDFCPEGQELDPTCISECTQKYNDERDQALKDHCHAATLAADDRDAAIAACNGDPQCIHEANLAFEFEICLLAESLKAAENQALAEATGCILDCPCIEVDPPLTISEFEEYYLEKH